MSMTDTAPRRHRILSAFVSLLGLLLLLLVVGITLLRSEASLGWIKSQIESAASEQDGLTLSIGRLQGPLPGRLILNGVVLSDPKGPWLKADRVALDWQPLSLLFGSLPIESLQVGKLRVERAPVLPESESTDSEPFAIPELPFELTLERLAIERLELGKALLGEAAALQITGSAGARLESGATTHLMVTRLDGVAGRINLTATLGPAGEQLSLDLEASEPPGGVIARLLALPNLPEVAAELHGAGPIGDWRGRLAGHVGTLADWRGDITLALSDRVTDLALSGSLGLRLDPASPVASMVNGETSYDLSLTLDRDETLSIERVSLHNTVLALTAEGMLALDDLESALDAQLALKRPEALSDIAPGLNVKDLTIAAAARGRLLNPKLEVGARASSLEITGVSAGAISLDLAATSEIPLTDPGVALKITGEGNIASLGIEGREDLDPLLSSGLQLDLDGVLDLASERVELATVTLGAPAFQAEARGEILLAEPRAKLDLALALPDLDAFAALAGQPLAGRAQLRAALDASPEDPEISLPFAIEFTELDLDLATADALLGTAPRAQGRVTRRADGAVDLTRFDIEGVGLGASLSAALPADLASLAADYELSIPDLAVLSKALENELTGRLALAGQAKGTLADPMIEATVEGESIQVAGLALDRATLNVTAETLVSGPRGRLQAELQTVILPNAPLTVETAFSQAGAQLKLEDLTLQAAGSALGGDLALDLDRGLASGALSGEIGDLLPWLALAGQRGTGRGKLGVDLSIQEERQAASVDVALTAPALSLEGGSSLSVATLSLRADSEDVTDLSGQAEIAAEALQLDDFLVERLSATGIGSAEAMDLTLSAVSENDHAFVLDAQGRLVLRDDDLALTLSRFAGTALDQPFALRAPLAMTRSGQRVAVRGLDMTLAGGRLSGDGTLDGRRIEAELAATALPLSIAGEIADLPALDGTLEARLSLEGTAPAPVGSGRLTIDRLKTARLADASPLRVEVEIDWRAARLALQGGITGFAESPATLSLKLPLSLDVESMAPVLDGEAPLAGALTWSGPIERVWPLVPVSDQELRGAADLKAEISGRVNAPVAGGRLAISGGRYEHAGSGTLLTDLELEVALTEQRAVIERFSAADGGGGQLDVEGAAELLPEQGFPFEVTASLQDFTAIRRDEVTGAIGGSVSAMGSLKAASLTGELETRGVEIRIPNQLPPDVVDLEVREVNRAAVGLPPEALSTEPTSATAIGINVGVELPGQVFVRGRGLDSEWRGNLRVTGSPEAPEVVGTLDLVRGQLAILSRDFTLTRGKIDFAGGQEIDPLLDIVAENESDDLTVALRLFGPASRPSFELTSQPVLPQDEVLARVLFGKATTQLTAIEALQLASAAAELSGKGTGTGALDFAHDLIGVDVLRFESAEGGAGAPALAAGKAVTDDVYVGIKQGATPGSGSAGVEIEVYPNVLLESGVGQGGSSNLGVKFKWDY